ncbi:hybrid sensor histidine kinase/response regulator transcription factor [Sediminitomix flava]|uniref:histidine kinase n=1 Tax=Sediminitomix flava TaxID=379075 RepID=A0A315Z8A0_SEDFL|nr:ATP-binding protein [Sediminitomix flava]PWJ41795.1 signal transduction histidine kinase [Sediminitomix flava]
MTSLERMIRHITFSIVLFFGLILNVEAQKQETEIDISKHLTSEHGLSHFGITSLLEDHLGLVWAGTFKGLNLYDGYEFKTFYTSTDSGLVSNRIQSLYQDENQNIIIGTEQGVSLYNYEKQSFKVIYSPHDQSNAHQGPFVNEILETEKFIICNTNLNGLFLFKKEDYTFYKKILPPFNSSTSFQSFRASKLDENHVLLASNLGLFSLQLDTEKFERVLPTALDYCLDVAYDGQQFIYALGFESLKVFRVHTNEDGLTFSFVQEALMGEFFSKLQISEEGNLWLLKNNNVLAEVQCTDSLINIDEEFIKYTFSNEFTRLSDIVLDKEGGWVGSYNQGLFKFRSKKRPFLNSDLKSKGINESSQVLSLLTLDKESILVTLNANDLKVFNTVTKQIQEIKSPAINNQNISKVLKDSNGDIWGGSRRLGIFRKKSIGKEWVQIRSEKYPFLEREAVRYFAEDRAGNIWVAGLNALYRFQLDQNRNISSVEIIDKLGEEPYTNSLVVQVIYPDPLEDCLWIGTKSKGLYKLNYHSSLADENQSIRLDLGDGETKQGLSITSIQRAENGILWFGSLEGGISKLEQEHGKVFCKTYTESNGLDDNDVMSFQFDEKGHLWIATNKGINEFNPETEVFRNYTTDDGLIPASFEVTSTKLANGMMVFGGNNGICYFHPNSIPTESPIPSLLFGDLKIHNKIVKVGAKAHEHVILQKPLNQSPKIELAYNESSISVEVISLHYSNTENHQIRYRLLPEDENWFVTSSKNKIINFSLLPPGEYTLQVANSNSRNEWSEVRALDIVVKPAYWLSPTAKVIYFLLAVIVLMVIMRVILHTKGLQHKLQLEHLEKTRLAELDAARLKLFMNISHEFRTPLTLITGPISVLRKMFETNKDAFQHIDLIQRQAKKMFQLVEQVHDIRKADENILKLHIASFDFTDFIFDIKRDFEKLAQDTGKELRLIGDGNQLFVMADEQKLEVVFNNLLNNAFKFTHAEDSITIRYTAKTDGLYFSVEDTGAGIPEEDLEHLFERFYQSNSEESYGGTGIGLELTKMLVEMHYGQIHVDSELGKGTKFEIFLPISVNKTDTLSAQKLEEILKAENHEERQRIVKKDAIDLTNLIKNEAHKNLTIYYVEDNIDLRNFVGNILEGYFKIVPFTNGKECMEALEKEWPDLILSDILMPKMNGLELCKLVKSDIKTSHIPVVLLTSRTSTDERIEGLEVGADTYISKPFEMKHLIASIQNVLNNRQKLRERFQVAYPIPLDKKQQSETDHIFLERLYKLLEENLSNEDIDLEEFAKELFMSRSQFFRKVKSITNSTPQEIIRSFKLKKASEYLSDGKYTVADVVVKTGFKSRTHFSKLFKEHFGQTPSQFAKQK